MGRFEQTKKEIFLTGLKNGIPIAVGYFAVAFSLGITARSCGFNAFQGFLASMTSYASAGQYIGFTLYAANSTLLQLVIMMLITNARYLLMGIALNQKIREGTPIGPRIMIGMTITDEIFGVTISRPGYVNPYFNAGVWSIALIFWSLGTAMGIAVGNILPLRAVSAMSVALYGMFLASIIPPVRKDKAIGIVIAFSFAFSYLFTVLPGVSELSSGNRTILLAVVISAAAALIAPRKNEEPEIAMEGGGSDE
ncbi:MAG: AzlC family ABC transporter permease [Firmicutes bacterium]|nr:AzlC family ABC transporter permease [Bacillota bacterium]